MTLRSQYSPEDLDLLTLTEPLACVRHAYDRLPKGIKVRSVLILGLGPIGMLHAIEVSKRFKNVRIVGVDPESKRRQLAKSMKSLEVVADVQASPKFDLAIVATSDPVANLTAIEAVDATGTVIHFSGLNHKTSKELVQFEGIDLERVHRNEEIRTTSSGKRLVGSSGYTQEDIKDAILTLQDNAEDYRIVQTGIYEGLDEVITTLLNDTDLAASHWKVVFRVGHADRNKVVVSTRVNGKLQAEVQSKKSNSVLKDGFVRVRMSRVSICNTDRRVLQGTKDARVTPHLVLGHEGIGEVIGASTGFHSLIGTGPVVILPHFYNESDSFMTAGMPHLSPFLLHLGVHIDGCFAYEVDVPASCIHLIKSKSSERRVA